MSRPCDITVIGAGPYGLSAAAELRAAGANVRVHGSPMSFWMHNMPKGMLLRSPWAASHIGAPNTPLSLDAFERARGRRTTRPVPLSDFVAYGHWFRQMAVPDIDERPVERVDPIDGGFRVQLDDGEHFESRRVVVAAGIAPFAKRPPVFDGLPPELATHSSQHEDLSRFKGERVAVIGRGQSGSEFAVLLHEAGAEVEVIARGRGRGMRWVGRAPHEGIIGRLLFDRTDVGPLMLSHLIARPTLLQRFPAWVHRESVRQALDPGASLWLRPRAGGVVVTSNRQVVEATRASRGVALRLDDGSRRTADHVLLATGYRIDVRLYRFLGPALLARLRRALDHPVLDEGFQSSIAGLHFVGAPAMQSFGPLVRFVSGTEFATRALVRSVTKNGLGAVDAEVERGVDVQRAPQRAQ
jgi:glycine/D-amino acid oxidase-like deaminating enzyme